MGMAIFKINPFAGLRKQHQEEEEQSIEKELLIKYKQIIKCIAKQHVNDYNSIITICHITKFKRVLPACSSTKKRDDRMMLKRKLKSEYKIFRDEVTWVEYALWWAGRLMLAYALVKEIKGGYGASALLQMKVELALTFALPVLHLLPRKIFIARLSYKTQDILVFMLFVTAYFGQYRGFYSTVEWYDAYLHIIGCFVCVFAGYALTKALKHDNLPMAPVVAAICGFGFSFFVAVSWEIFEFTCDTIWASSGSNSQNWMNIDSSQLVALLPAADPRHYALYDTMSDLAAGTIGSILGGIAIFPYVSFMNKKAANKLKLVKTKIQSTGKNEEKSIHVG